MGEAHLHPGGYAWQNTTCEACGRPPFRRCSTSLNLTSYALLGALWTEDVGDANGHLIYDLVSDTHMLLPALRRPDRATVRPVLPLDSATTVARSWGAPCSSGLWQTAALCCLSPLPSCRSCCPCRATLAPSRWCSAPVPGHRLGFGAGRLWLVHAPWLAAKGSNEPSEASCTAASRATTPARALSSPLATLASHYQLADPHVNHHGAVKSQLL